MRSAGYHEKVIGRTYFGGDQVTQLNVVLYNTIKWPSQPKHSPSFNNWPINVNIPVAFMKMIGTFLQMS